MCVKGLSWVEAGWGVTRVQGGGRRAEGKGYKGEQGAVSVM